MSNISAWSPSAAENNQASPNGAPEGWLAPAVNDWARETMAAVARFWRDLSGSLTSAGSSNAYTLTTNSNHQALASIGPIAFKANHTNTGAATLNVDGLGAKALLRSGGTALVAGDITQNQIVLALYNPQNDNFEYLNFAGEFEKLGISRAWRTETSNHILELTDAGKTVEMSNSSARTITVPTNASVAFSVGAYVNLARGGSGSVQIVAAEGVTLRAPNGAFLASQYSMATIQKKSTNEWWLAGDLTESA